MNIHSNEKGNIELFIKNRLNDTILNNTHLESLFRKFADFAPVKKGKFIEVTHFYSGATSFLPDQSQHTTVLIDNPAEALLIYHAVQKENLTVINGKYSLLGSNEHYEKYDFLFSLCGIYFSDIYKILPDILSCLKVDGIAAITIPSYWYKRDNLSDIEKALLDYSKKTDSKWMFIDPIEPLIMENKGELITRFETDISFSTDRKTIAKFSSLDTLYNAELSNNRAILEICPLPINNVRLPLSVILIKKCGKTLNASNLFK